MSTRKATVGSVLLGIVSGKSLKTLDRPPQGNEFGILKVSAVTWGEFRPAESKAMPSDYAPGDCPRPMDGDILISRANTRELVGAPVMVEGNHPKLLLSDKLLKLIPDETVVDRRYLVRALRSPTTAAHFSTRAGGSSGSMTNITQADIREAVIPLPPLAQQRRLAAILDQADALRAKRREALAHLDSLAQSMFIEMFGDPGPNPMNWPQRSLGSLAIRKPNNGVFRKNDEYGSGVPVVWVEELFKGEQIDVSNARRLEATNSELEKFGLLRGDLLFCRSSLKLEGIGQSNVYLGGDRGALFECHVIRISPDQAKVSPVFLNAALRMPSQRLKLMKLAKTSTMTTIDQESLQSISLPIPPRELQLQYEDRVSHLATLKRNQDNQLEEMQTLFASLQHRAFSGAL